MQTVTSIPGDGIGPSIMEAARSMRSSSKPRIIKRILVIKLRALGDVIMATPVLRNLRLAFPGAEIDFLTEPASAPIIGGHPTVHDVLVLDRNRLGQLSFWQRLAAQRDFVRTLRQRNYDLVLDLFGNPRSAILTRLSGAPMRVGYRFRVRQLAYNHIVEPRGDRVHEVEFNLDALRALGIPILTKALEIASDSNAAAEIERYWLDQNLHLSDIVIGLNPSGGWYTKRWPLHSFAELGDRLQTELSAKVLLLWGPGELENAQAIARLMHTKPIVAPPTDLPQLAALLARLDLLISNDSGPLHLAAAMSTPVIGIFGPTKPELQGPWGEGHEVVLKTGLPCLGCNGVTCRIKTHDCMQTLSVAEVYQAVLHLVQNLNRSAATATSPGMP